VSACPTPALPFPACATPGPAVVDRRPGVPRIRAAEPCDGRESDAALLARAACGDGDALGALYDRHAPLVLGLAVRLLGDRGEAEEVLQEVFLQAWREAQRYRADLAPPRGWLLLLARSRALDRLKSDAARRRREDATVRLAATWAEMPRGVARLERLERRRRIRSALGHLSTEQRQAVELAFFEGLTHTQMSERLRLPLGTVKSRVLLGMRKLRQALALDGLP
jgi:RNA polymerase sigma-70 factor (ECF subfamily)